MSNSSTVEVQQIEDDREVSIRADLENKYIFRTHFYLDFQLIDKSKLHSLYISNIMYFYSNNKKKGWSSSIFIYQEDNRGLKQITRTKNLDKRKNKIDFIVYASPCIDIDSKQSQAELKPYLEKYAQRSMISRKDTLSIGTFSDFKRQHPALLNTLLEGDSVRFYISDTQSKFDTIITLPIKY